MKTSSQFRRPTSKRGKPLIEPWQPPVGVRIVDFLKSHPNSCMGEIYVGVGANESNIREHMVGLKRKGIIKISGNCQCGRSQLYSAKR